MFFWINTKSKATEELGGNEHKPSVVQMVTASILTSQKHYTWKHFQNAMKFFVQHHQNVSYFLLQIQTCSPTTYLQIFEHTINLKQ